MRKQKGITLIALIISIIVLLILAVVTIGTVKDSGIIDHAENAKDSYTIAQEKEQIGLAVSEYQLEKTISGTNPIFKDIIITALHGQVDSVEGDNEGPLTVTFKSGNIYTVQQNGDISEYVPSEDEDDIEVWVKNEDGTYTKGDTTVEIGVTTYTTSEVLEKLGITPSADKYTGDWVVIGVEADKLKLMSAENVGSDIVLGYNDPGAIAAKKAQNEDAPTDAEKLERAVWSYNNVDKTLKDAVKTSTGIESAVSVTLEDLEKLLDIKDSDKSKKSYYGDKFRFFYNPEDETDNNVYCEFKSEGESWPDSMQATSSTGYTTFRSNDRILTRGGEPIEEIENYYTYKISTDQMTKYPFLLAGSQYWLNSRMTGCSGYGVSYRIVLTNGKKIINQLLFYSYGGDLGDTSAGVRAVVNV